MPAGPVDDDPRTWRALLICPSIAMRGAAERALGPGHVREITSLNEYPGLWEIASLLPEYQVCLIDGSSDSPLALQLLTRITGAKIPAIVLHPCPEDIFVVECLRRGASEVIAYCEAKETLIDSALANVAARRHYSARPALLPGTVYGVISGKGGSGCTTTSTQLATRLAEARPRRTLLVDLDGITGGVAFLLRQTPSHNVLQVSANLTRLDEDLFKRTVVEVGPLDVLLAPLESASFHISIEDLPHVIEFCRSLYDCVILDLPSCHSDLSVGIARIVDALLLVSNHELAAVHATLRTISYLQRSGVPPARIKLVLNRYRHGESLFDSLGPTFRETVFAHISEAGEDLRRALLGDVPIPPGSDYACDIAGLAHKLTGWPTILSLEPQKKFGLHRLIKRWHRTERSNITEHASTP